MKRNIAKSNWTKRILTATTVASLCMGLVACGSSSGKQDKDSAGKDQKVTVIKAATSGNPRPFTYVDDDGKLKGHNIELIEAVFDKLPQYKLEIETTEFSSIFTGIDAGHYRLGVNNIAKNPEREAKYLYTDPEMENHYLVVANKNVNIENINDLTELQGTHYIGAAGNDKTTLIENYNDEHPEQQITIDYSDADVLTQLQAVEAGTEDFLVIDEPMYKGYYEPEFKLDVKTYSLENVKSATYSYFIVGKDDTQLADDINQALKEVIKDGTSKKINEKYFGADYSPKVE